MTYIYTEGVWHFGPVRVDCERRAMSGLLRALDMDLRKTPVDRRGTFGKLSTMYIRLHKHLQSFTPLSDGYQNPSKSPDTARRSRSTEVPHPFRIYTSLPLLQYCLVLRG